MTPDDLLAIARGVAAQAKPNEEIEVACSYGQSRSIRVYEGEVESLTTADNSGVGVRVLIDGREGFANAGSLDPDVVADMLSEARDNAAFAEADPYVGLARPDGVEPVEVELWRGGVGKTSNQDKIDLVVELERRARAKDSRVTGVRVASYGDNEGSFALASTSGIEAATEATSASVSIQVLAVDGDRITVRTEVPVGLSVTGKVRFRYWEYRCVRDGDRFEFVGYSVSSERASEAGG